jgi:hypothetical protein
MIQKTNKELSVESFNNKELISENNKLIKKIEDNLLAIEKTYSDYFKEHFIDMCSESKTKDIFN